METEQEILDQHNDERTKCQTWTRVMGYLRPTDSFNTGKQGEYEERTFFEEKTCCSHCDKQD